MQQQVDNVGDKMYQYYVALEDNEKYRKQKSKNTLNAGGGAALASQI